MAKKNKQIDLDKLFRENSKKKPKSKLLGVLITLLVLLIIAEVVLVWAIHWNKLAEHEFVCHSNTLIPKYYATDESACAIYYASNDWTCKNGNGKGDQVWDAETYALFICSYQDCGMWYTALGRLYENKVYEICFNETIPQINPYTTAEDSVAHIIADNYVHKTGFWERLREDFRLW